MHSLKIKGLCGGPQAGVALAMARNPNRRGAPCRSRTSRTDQRTWSIRRPALHRRHARRAAPRHLPQVDRRRLAVRDGKMFDGSSIKRLARHPRTPDMVLLPDPSTRVPRSVHRGPDAGADLRHPRPDHDAGLHPRSARRGVALRPTSRPTASLTRRSSARNRILHPRQRPLRQRDGPRVLPGRLEEAHWNSGRDYEGGNSGYRPMVKGGYAGRSRWIRCTTSAPRCARRWNRSASRSRCTTTKWRTPASARSAQFNSLVQKADEPLTMKYVIKNVAAPQRQDRDLHACPSSATTAAACTCTSRWPRRQRTCSLATATAVSSQMALWYIGGIFWHARAINAFANSTTNSWQAPGAGLPRRR